jgi:hypothetical protein
MFVNATLIDPQWLLTCASIGTPGSILIGEETYKVIEAIKHPQYGIHEGYDFQLLKLDRHVKGMAPVRRGRTPLNPASENPTEIMLMGTFEDNPFLSTRLSAESTIKLDLLARAAGINTVDRKENSVLPQLFTVTYTESNPLEVITNDRDTGSGVYRKIRLSGGRGEEYELVGLTTPLRTPPIRNQLLTPELENRRSILCNITVGEVNTWIDNVIIVDALKPNAPAASASGESRANPTPAPVPAATPRPTTPPHSSTEVEWNILVYANDQDLQGFRIFEFTRLLALAANNPKIRVLLQYKCLPGNREGKLLPLRRLNNQVIEEFRGTRRFEIRAQNAGGEGSSSRASAARVKVLEILDNFDPNINLPLKDIQARVTNMGDITNFKRFMQWGIRFPAKHTMLVFWVHGGGWKWLSNDGTAFHIQEINRALQEVLGQRKLDILRFDSCRTQMYEVAYELKDRAHYIVASQQTTPLDLVPITYANTLRFLSENPACGVRELATKSLDIYKDSIEQYLTTLEGLVADYQDRGATWTPEHGYTMSVIDPTKLPELKELVDQLAANLITDYRAKKLTSAIVGEVRRSVQKLGAGNLKDCLFVDLYDLVDKLGSYNQLSLPTVELCQRIKQLLTIENYLIVKNITGGDHVRNCHGLSIDFSSHAEFIPTWALENGATIPNEQYTIYSTLRSTTQKTNGNSWFDWLRIAP